MLFAWSGLYNVAASAGHWPITRNFLHYVMKQSVAFHAPHLKAPSLNDSRLVLRGATYYHTGCAPCHGAPGIRASPIERSFTPPPPPLYDMSQIFDRNELYWIVKHGIKMTAMPAWPTQQRNDEVWAMVAFLLELPHLDRNGYQTLAIGGPGPAVLAGREPGTDLSAEIAPNVSIDCARCHGVDGRGRDHAFPNIAGLDRTYILDQLGAFADGARPSGFMQPVASRLTDKAKQDFATYFASLCRVAKQSPVADKEELELGNNIARFGVSRRVPACLSCHAVNPADLSPGIPQLTGQVSDYLVDQLMLFRSEVRAQTRNDKIMSGFAKQLTAKQIIAVSAYFASLGAEERTSLGPVPNVCR